MKSFLSLALLFLLISCGKQENKTEQQNQKEVNTRPANPSRNTLMDIYELLKANPLPLSETESLDLPEMKVVEGKYKVYDPAFDEPVAEALVSEQQMEIPYGDYAISLVLLKTCGNESNVAVTVSSLKGNFTAYSLLVYNVSETNQLVNITEKVVDFAEINKALKIKKNETAITKAELQFKLGKAGDVMVMLNQSKLSPIFAEANPDAAILKTSAAEQEKKISLIWSGDDCKYQVK